MRFRAVTAALVLAFAVAVPGQEATDAIKRLVVADAEKALHDSDATVRGEAALLLAGTGDPTWHDEILAVAKEEEPAARDRGLVALGLLGAPGTDRVLGRVLDDSSSRVKPEGLAAALALGLMAPEAAPGEVARILTRFLQANYKRQRELIGAVLLAMAGRDQSPQRVALLQLFDDAANRDPLLRAQLVLVLGRVQGALDVPRLAAAIERGLPEERLAALTVLRDHPRDGEAPLLPTLTRLATTGGTPELRAMALAVLTRMRHLPALDMAARATRSAHAVEAAQGARSALLLGGAGMRGPLEQQILATATPALQAAMLGAFSGPLSTEFADTCLRLAANRKGGIALRVAAALTLAQGDDERCIPVLRDAFLDSDDPAQLEALAVALLRIEKTPPPLDRLHRGSRPEDLAGEPTRLIALLVAGHPQAQRVVLTGLQRPTTPPKERAALLRAWRLACQFALPRERARLLPESLRPLFP
ncbi:MAG: hypothetical protein IPK26_30545 [Planctomycetes bacterium]|nr:hypothetical protein [Planctomycetota bacterium]